MTSRSEEPTAARWIKNDAQWYEERPIHCDCCGRLIATDLFVAEIAGKTRRFCEEECERLFLTYLLPVRGDGYRPPADVLERYEELMAK